METNGNQMLYLWTCMTHLSKNCQLLHQQMSPLCFPGSTLPTDHNTLYTERHKDYRDSSEDSQLSQKPSARVKTTSSPREAVKCSSVIPWQHYLVCVVRHHGLVGDVSHSEDVRWVGCTLGADVHLSVL